MDLASQFKGAWASAGPGGLFVAAVSEAINLLRAKVRGNPYKRVLPKQFSSSSSLTLSATLGQTSDFAATDFKNDGKYPYLLLGIYPITTTGTSAWRLDIADSASGETFFGSPTPIRISQLVDSNLQPTPLTKVWYRMDPNGGFLPHATSVGAADIVELTLAGLWIVEE